jgi:hypothetical protein
MVFGILSWVVGFLLTFQEYVRPIEIPRLLIFVPFAFLGFLLLLWGLIWPRRVRDYLLKVRDYLFNEDDEDTLTVSVGLPPSQLLLDIFQSAKLVPVLVGQHYRVRLMITNKHRVPLSNVTMWLRMWVKRHGQYEPSCEPVKILKTIKPHSTIAWDSHQAHLMHDTGGADLELLDASANGKPIPFEYQNRASETFTCVYHVEPWRSAVLGIGISILALAVALVVLMQRCR